MSEPTSDRNSEPTSEQTFELTFQRTLDAPPEVVFRAWTEHDSVSRWLGCGPRWELRIGEWDARVGGRVEGTVHSLEGEELARMEGTFSVVESPSRLEYSWGPARVEVGFSAVDGGTEVHVRFVSPTEWFGADREMICELQTAGWGHSLDLLSALVSDRVSP